jgi:hypothetical protein
MDDLSQEANSIQSEIAAAESRLSALIQENNSLELGAATRQFEYLHRDRPTALHNLLVDTESSLYGNSSLGNPQYIEHTLLTERQEIPRLDSAISDLTARVDAKRTHLLSLLRQVQTDRPPPAPVPGPGSTCGPEIESLARQWTSEIDDVDHNELINFLARGPADFTPDEFLEKSKTVAELRFDLQVSDLVNHHLQILIPQIDQIAAACPCDSEVGIAELSAQFEQASNELEKLVETEVSNEPVDLGPWEEIERTVGEIEVLRINLRRVIEDSGGLSCVGNLADVAQEKEALRRGLEVLNASIEVLGGYLEELQEKGVVDSKVYSAEEIREIRQRWRQLKEHA